MFIRRSTAWLVFGLALTPVLSIACREVSGDILRSGRENVDSSLRILDSATELADADDGSALQDADETSAPPDADDVSAPQDADADTSATTTAQLDQLLGPWGTVEPPTPIAALASTFNDDDPTVTSDLLELYFTSTRNGSTNIYASKRIAIDVPWGAPALVTSLSTAGIEDSPEIAPDGLTIWFVRSVKGTTTGRDVYVATRPARSAAWSSGTLVSELSSPSEDYSPTPSGDGLTMVLSSYRAPSLGADNLFSSRRPSLASRWTAPTWVPVLESTARESGPFRPGDDTLIYFTSWRAGPQIWRATRADSSHPWNAPSVVSELTPSPNSAEQPWISPDLRLMYFVIKAPNRTTQIGEARR